MILKVHLARYFLAEKNILLLKNMFWILVTVLTLNELWPQQMEKVLKFCKGTSSGQHSNKFDGTASCCDAASNTLLSLSRMECQRTHSDCFYVGQTLPCVLCIWDDSKELF